MACCVVVGFAMRGAGNEDVRKYEILIELDFTCAVSVNSIRSESIERLNCLVCDSEISYCTLCES